MKYQINSNSKDRAPLSSGFSLMEVMITLIIVAVLIGIAYPGYQKMVIKSRQAEAKNILQAIYTAQSLHKTETLSYSGSLTDLDIEVPEDTVYAYSISLKDSEDGFTASATANLDDDEAVDEWQIDESNTLTNIVNDAIE